MSTNSATRLNEHMMQTPIVTLGILGICCSAYIIQIVLDIDVTNFTMCPQLVIRHHQYYRLVTSSLFHGSVMHLVMNMMSSIALSSFLEKRLGSLRHLETVIWSMLLTSIFYLGIALVLKFLFHMDGLMYTHALGFSCVLFHMLVLECNLNSPNMSRSIFGMTSFTVPSYLYPFALLIVLQVILPNISFVGHLTGIISGTLQLYGFLDYVMVSDTTLQRWEEANGSFCLTRFQNFIPTPSQQQQQQQNQVLLQQRSVLGHSFRSALQSMSNCTYKFFDTLKVSIFGRGREANENIYVRLDIVDDHDDNHNNDNKNSGKDDLHASESQLV